MQDIAISPQIILPSHSTTPANTDISSANNQPNDKFSKIMAHEASNNAAISQQDNNLAENPQVTPINQMQGESGQFTKEIETPTLSVEAGHDEAGMFLITPGVSAANKIDQPILNELTQSADTPLPLIASAQAQTIVPALSQHTSIQENSSSNTPGPSNTPGQFYNTADFAAANKMMPLSAETSSNSALPINEAPTIPLTFDTAQSTVPDSTTILTTSAPSSSLPPTVSTASTVFSSPEISLDTQLGQPKWGDEFAQKIVWLAGQQQQAAEIRLNPAHLGPIEIMLSITNDQGTQATAQFVSSQLAVREAIEAALPKLREMMADNGITLGNVTVDSNSSQHQRDAWRQESAARSFSADQPDTHNETIDQLKTTKITSKHHGMVNTFA